MLYDMISIGLKPEIPTDEFIDNVVDLYAIKKTREILLL